VIAEGAGATPVAAALSDKMKDKGRIACVVSGGNIDFEKLAKIFRREL
jgi:threonine dehydratase